MKNFFRGYPVNRGFEGENLKDGRGNSGGGGMTEDVIAIFPASEVWGLNRRWPCTIILSGERMVVLKAERVDGRRPHAGILRARLQSSDIGEMLQGSHYSLPFERMRWVEAKSSLMGALVKIHTSGGSYRFRLRKRHCRKLERHLRQILGDRVKGPRR
jgi:hypothetical protein